MNIMSGNSSIRVGLIGVGGFGEVHLRSLAGMEEEGSAVLSAVADPCLVEGNSQRNGFLERGVAVHTDYRNLLKAGGLDLVVIATPIPLHEEMAREAIASGVYVYLEKPPVPTIQQLLRLIDLDKLCRVTVGFQIIVSPALQTLKRTILEGGLGEIRSITTGACWPRTAAYYGRSSWAGRMRMDDGTPVFDGPATNALAHLVHNIMFLAGSEPDGFGIPQTVTAGLYRARSIESYDAAFLAGVFPSGTKFTFAAAHCSKTTMPWELHVTGTKGRASLVEDGSLLKSDIGLSIPTVAEVVENRLLLYRSILAWMRGDISRPPTLLADCLGYSKSTCGALLASGGIHEIPPGHVHGFGEGPEHGCDVPEIPALIRGALDSDLPFSGVSWSVPGREIALAQLDRVDV
jgi:predicted dehydrogenase